MPRSTIRGRIHRGACGSGKLEYAGLGLLTRPAGPIRNNDEIVAESICLDHAFETADPTARRRAADRCNTEALENTGRNFSVAVDTIHDAGLGAVIAKAHEYNAAMPKRHDDLLTTVPASNQIIRSDFMFSCRHLEKPEEGGSEAGPQTNFYLCP